MKKKVKIKDEYNIRIKKRILREIKDSEKKFVTTYKEIKNILKFLINHYLRISLTPLMTLRLKE
jgi:hypothetical protein